METKEYKLMNGWTGNGDKVVVQFRHDGLQYGEGKRALESKGDGRRRDSVQMMYKGIVYNGDLESFLDV
jgi:hypothetical protein